MEKNEYPLDVDNHIADLIRTLPRLGFTIMKMRVDISEDKKYCRSAHINEKMRVTINKEYFESISPIQRIAILKHEAMHVIHKHWQRLTEVKHKDVREIAEEIQINQHIEDLPTDTLTCEQFDLPRGLSLEEYYEELLKKKKKNPKSLKLKFDKNPLKGDADNLQEIEVEKAETLCKEAEAYDKAVGKDSGDMFEDIKIIPTNYKARVRRFMGTQPSKSKIKKTRSRYSKRYPMSPGIKKELELGNIIFILDTSGSMDKDELGQSIDCGNKLSYLCSNLIFIQGDTEVGDVDTRRAKNVQSFTVKGRGGTDMRPLIQEAKKYGYPKVPYVMFTDGELWEWPDEDDMRNCIWIITNKRSAEEFHKRFPKVEYAVML
jgi:predicted metal-dependent peptidase